MKRILVFSLLAAILAACSKDKFQTVPQVRIVSFGPDEVRKGQTFELVAQITDNEGDIQDSVLLVQKRFTGDLLFTTDTLRIINLKDFGFTNKRNVELRLIFSYGEIRPGTITYGIQEPVDRGLQYGIIVRDTAKNRSEYVESKRIILKKVQ